jgi:transcriptional/translational regulatory protein YebC/TACO1
LFTVQRQKSHKRKPDLSDAEVREILVHAMAEVGADPALVYAFQKTGVYVCEENEKRLPKSSLKAFDAAVDEYRSALNRRVQ